MRLKICLEVLCHLSTCTVYSTSLGLFAKFIRSILVLSHHANYDTMSSKEPNFQVVEMVIHGSEASSEMEIYDRDQRRLIKARLRSLPLRAHPNDSYDDLDEEGRSERRQQIIAHVMTSLIGVLSSEVTCIDFTSNAQLVAVSTKVEDDINPSNYYPPFATYETGSRNIRTVLRSELTELERFGPCTDLVSYHEDGQEKCVVFTCAIENWKPTTRLWQLAHILMKLPIHPNIPPIDRFVLEEITKEGVVGFTTKFISGGTFLSNRSRVFKLKWMRQLMAVIDDLNLKYGLMHQDLTDRNLLVDSETDTIQVIDFGEAVRIGDKRLRNCEWYRPELNDVKGVIIFLNSIITANPKYIDCRLLEVEEPDIDDPIQWVQHPKVQLDHEAADFCKELREWVTKRRSGTQLTHFTQAPQYLNWPQEFPPRPQESVLVPYTERPEYSLPFSRQEMLGLGRPYLGWERPPTSQLEPNRRLLATGRYADERGYDFGYDIEAIKEEIATKQYARSHPSGKNPLEHLFNNLVESQPVSGKKRKAADAENGDKRNGTQTAKTGPRTRAQARAERMRVASAEPS